MNVTHIGHRLARKMIWLTLVVWGVARADLISLDSSYGLDTVTLDTDTGLLWLDLDLTAGRSYDDVSGQLGPGGEFEGFRYAITDEVLGLWTNAAIPDITFEGPIEPADFTNANLAPAQALAGLIGITGQTPGGPLSEGLTDTAPPGDDTMRIVGELNICTQPICANLLPGQANVALASLGPNNKGTGVQTAFIGSYLISSALDPIGGSTSQAFNQFVLCRNLTAGESVSLPGLAGAPSWDCTAAGLSGAPGDQIVQVVRSTAGCGPGNPCAITGTVSGVEDLLAVCRNLTTSQTRLAVVDNTSWDCAAGGFSAMTGQRLQLLLRGNVPAPLPACTIEFDTGCPDVTPECGASFAGGNGCVIAGLPGCYSSGAFGYEVAAGDQTTITLDGDLWKLDVFFASGGPGQGQMSFFDASGAQVDAPLLTNGDCSLNMPPSQRVSFSRPVRTIVVDNDGPSNIYLDTFRVNAP